MSAQQQTEAARYHYKAHGGVYGPVTLARIQELVTRGEIDPSTPMRADGVHAWEPVQVYGVEIPAAPEPAPPISAPAASPASKASNLGGTVLLVALALGAAFWWFWPRGFSDADIERVKDSIREEYAKKRDELELKDVTLLRKERRELVGFVKVRHIKIDLEQTLDCSATMAEDSSNFLWRCGR